jgi:CelD/BcsL family acetyltransferase involved in cellulose biosynthesis
VPNLDTFEFWYVPDETGTGKRLEAAAERLGLSCHVVGQMPVPVIDLAAEPDRALSAANSKQSLRHERWFQREAPLEVLHLKDGAAILPHLDEFFEQHIARRAATDRPSIFADRENRLLWERATRMEADEGWLRFTRIDWAGRPIAFHYGTCYRGRYTWGMPTFAVDLARRSPGQVLLRHVLLDAIQEGAHTFDFGWGDEPFKLRFATETRFVRAWRLHGN